MANSTYKQVTHGNKREAKNLRRDANTLDRLLKSKDRSLANLKKQLAAGKVAIKQDLDRNIGNIKWGQDKAAGNYAQLGVDNDSAESDNSRSSMLNHRRERSQGLAQVQAQGGGETDALQAQATALRNWSANQQETNRSYADSLTSLNNSINDTNVQVRSEYNKAATDANNNMRDAYNQYWGAQGTILGEKADLYGQQKNLYGQAADARGTKTDRTKTTGSSTNQTTHQYTNFGNTAASRANERAARRAANGLVKNANQIAELSGKSYTGKAKTAEQLGYKEIQQQQFKQNMASLDNSMTLTKMKAPEGSTLRKW